MGELFNSRLSKSIIDNGNENILEASITVPAIRVTKELSDDMVILPKLYKSVLKHLKGVKIKDTISVTHALNPIYITCYNLFKGEEEEDEDEDISLGNKSIKEIFPFIIMFSNKKKKIYYGSQKTNTKDLLNIKGYDFIEVNSPVAIDKVFEEFIKVDFKDISSDKELLFEKNNVSILNKFTINKNLNYLGKNDFVSNFKIYSDGKKIKLDISYPFLDKEKEVILTYLYDDKNDVFYYDDIRQGKISDKAEAITPKKDNKLSKEIEEKEKKKNLWKSKVEQFLNKKAVSISNNNFAVGELKSFIEEMYRNDFLGEYYGYIMFSKALRIIMNSPDNSEIKGNIKYVFEIIYANKDKDLIMEHYSYILDFIKNNLAPDFATNKKHILTLKYIETKVLEGYFNFDDDSNVIKSFSEEFGKEVDKLFLIIYPLAYRKVIMKNSLSNDDDDEDITKDIAKLDRLADESLADTDESFEDESFEDEKGNTIKSEEIENVATDKNESDIESISVTEETVDEDNYEYFETQEEEIKEELTEKEEENLEIFQYILNERFINLEKKLEEKGIFTQNDGNNYISNRFLYSYFIAYYISYYSGPLTDFVVDNIIQTFLKDVKLTLAQLTNLYKLAEILKDITYDNSNELTVMKHQKLLTLCLFKNYRVNKIRKEGKDEFFIDLINFNEIKEYRKTHKEKDYVAQELSNLSLKSDDIALIIKYQEMVKINHNIDYTPYFLPTEDVNLPPLLEMYNDNFMTVYLTLFTWSLLPDENIVKKISVTKGIEKSSVFSSFGEVNTTKKLKISSQFEVKNFYPNAKEQVILNALIELCNGINASNSNNVSNKISSKASKKKVRSQETFILENINNMLDQYIMEGMFVDSENEIATTNFFDSSFLKELLVFKYDIIKNAKVFKALMVYAIFTNIMRSISIDSINKSVTEHLKKMLESLSKENDIMKKDFKDKVMEWAIGYFKPMVSEKEQKQEFNNDGFPIKKDNIIEAKKNKEEPKKVITEEEKAYLENLNKSPLYKKAFNEMGSLLYAKLIDILEEKKKSIYDFYSNEYKFDNIPGEYIGKFDKLLAKHKFTKELIDIAKLMIDGKTNIMFNNSSFGKIGTKIIEVLNDLNDVDYWKEKKDEKDGRMIPKYPTKVFRFDFDKEINEINNSEYAKFLSYDRGVQFDFETLVVESAIEDMVLGWFNFYEQITQLKEKINDNYKYSDIDITFVKKIVEYIHRYEGNYGSKDYYQDLSTMTVPENANLLLISYKPILFNYGDDCKVFVKKDNKGNIIKIDTENILKLDTFKIFLEMNGGKFNTSIDNAMNYFLSKVKLTSDDGYNSSDMNKYIKFTDNEQGKKEAVLFAKQMDNLKKNILKYKDLFMKIVKNALEIEESIKNNQSINEFVGELYSDFGGKEGLLFLSKNKNNIESIYNKIKIVTLNFTKDELIVLLIVINKYEKEEIKATYIKDNKINTNSNIFDEKFIDDINKTIKSGVMELFNSNLIESLLGEVNNKYMIRGIGDFSSKLYDFNDLFNRLEDIYLIIDNINNLKINPDLFGESPIIIEINQEIDSIIADKFITSEVVSSLNKESDSLQIEEFKKEIAKLEGSVVNISELYDEAIVILGNNQIKMFKDNITTISKYIDKLSKINAILSSYSADSKWLYQPKIYSDILKMITKVKNEKTSLEKFEEILHIYNVFSGDLKKYRVKKGNKEALVLDFEQDVKVIEKLVKFLSFIFKRKDFLEWKTNGDNGKLNKNSDINLKDFNNGFVLQLRDNNGDTIEINDNYLTYSAKIEEAIVNIIKGISKIAFKDFYNKISNYTKIDNIKKVYDDIEEVTKLRNGYIERLNNNGTSFAAPYLIDIAKKNDFVKITNEKEPEAMAVGYNLKKGDGNISIANSDYKEQDYKDMFKKAVERLVNKKIINANDKNIILEDDFENKMKQAIPEAFGYEDTFNKPIKEWDNGIAGLIFFNGVAADFKDIEQKGSSDRNKEFKSENEELRILSLKDSDWIYDIFDLMVLYKNVGVLKNYLNKVQLNKKNLLKGRFIFLLNQYLSENLASSQSDVEIFMKKIKTLDESNKAVKAVETLNDLLIMQDVIEKVKENIIKVNDNNQEVTTESIIDIFENSDFIAFDDIVTGALKDEIDINWEKVLGSINSKWNDRENVDSLYVKTIIDIMSSLPNKNVLLNIFNDTYHGLILTSEKEVDVTDVNNVFYSILNRIIDNIKLNTSREADVSDYNNQFSYTYHLFCSIMNLDKYYENHHLKQLVLDIIINITEGLNSDFIDNLILEELNEFSSEKNILESDEGDKVEIQQEESPEDIEEVIPTDNQKEEDLSFLDEFYEYVTERFKKFLEVPGAGVSVRKYKSLNKGIKESESISLYKLFHNDIGTPIYDKYGQDCKGMDLVDYSKYVIRKISTTIKGKFDELIKKYNSVYLIYNQATVQSGKYKEWEKFQKIDIRNILEDLTKAFDELPEENILRNGVSEDAKAIFDSINNDNKEADDKKGAEKVKKPKKIKKTTDEFDGIIEILARIASPNLSEEVLSIPLYATADVEILSISESSDSFADYLDISYMENKTIKTKDANQINVIDDKALLYKLAEYKKLLKTESGYTSIRNRGDYVTNLKAGTDKFTGNKNFHGIDVTPKDELENKDTDRIITFVSHNKNVLNLGVGIYDSKDVVEILKNKLKEAKIYKNKYDINIIKNYIYALSIGGKYKAKYNSDGKISSEFLSAAKKYFKDKADNGDYDSLINSVKTELKNNIKDEYVKLIFDLRNKEANKLLKQYLSVFLYNLEENKGVIGITDNDENIEESYDDLMNYIGLYVGDVINVNIYEEIKSIRLKDFNIRKEEAYENLKDKYNLILKLNDKLADKNKSSLIPFDEFTKLVNDDMMSDNEKLNNYFISIKGNLSNNDIEKRFDKLYNNFLSIHGKDYVNDKGELKYQEGLKDEEVKVNKKHNYYLNLMKGFYNGKKTVNKIINDYFTEFNDKFNGIENLSKIDLISKIEEVYKKQGSRDNGVQNDFKIIVSESNSNKFKTYYIVDNNEKFFNAVENNKEDYYEAGLCYSLDETEIMIFSQIDEIVDSENRNVVKFYSGKELKDSFFMPLKKRFDDLNDKKNDNIKKYLKKYIELCSRFAYPNSIGIYTDSKGATAIFFGAVPLHIYVANIIANKNFQDEYDNFMQETYISTDYVLLNRAKNENKSVIEIRKSDFEDVIDHVSSTSKTTFNDPRFVKDTIKRTKFASKMSFTDDFEAGYKLYGESTHHEDTDNELGLLASKYSRYIPRDFSVIDKSKDDVMKIFSEYGKYLVIKNHPKMNGKLYSVDEKSYGTMKQILKNNFPEFDVIGKDLVMEIGKIENVFGHIYKLAVKNNFNDFAIAAMNYIYGKENIISAIGLQDYFFDIIKIIAVSKKYSEVLSEKYTREDVNKSKYTDSTYDEFSGLDSDDFIDEFDRIMDAAENDMEYKEETQNAKNFLTPDIFSSFISFDEVSMVLYRSIMTADINLLNSKILNDMSIRENELFYTAKYWINSVIPNETTTYQSFVDLMQDEKERPKLPFLIGIKNKIKELTGTKVKSNEQFANEYFTGIVVGDNQIIPKEALFSIIGRFLYTKNILDIVDFLDRIHK